LRTNIPLISASFAAAFSRMSRFHTRQSASRICGMRTRSRPLGVVAPGRFEKGLTVYAFALIDRQAGGAALLA